MDRNTGFSVATHINDNSSRFSASVLDFARQSWVIVRDNKQGHTQTYIEPIMDVPDYLARATRKSPRLEEEFQALLHSWLARHPADSVGAPLLETALDVGPVIADNASKALGTKGRS